MVSTTIEDLEDKGIDPTELMPLMRDIMAKLEHKEEIITEAQNADAYYLAFELWFKNNYYHEIDGKFYYSIVYDYTDKQFWEYKPIGYWEILDIDQIDKTFQQWADEAGIETSDSKFSHSMKRLRGVVGKKYAWDTKEYANLLNGIYIFKERRLVEHSEKYMTKHQWGFEFLGDVQPQPYWNRIIEVYPEQIKHFESSLLAALYKDETNEVFYFGVGPTGSGKGTIAQMIQIIFNNMICYQRLEELDNERFGCEPLLGKRILLNREGTIGYYSASVLGFLKDIVTHEGPVNINRKNKPIVSDFMDLWIYIFANGLSKLPERADRKAWFRRTIIDEYNKTMIRDPDFKANVKLEASAIMTNLMLKDYEPIMTSGTDIEAMVKKNADLWDLWSDPVKALISSMFERTDNPNDKLLADDVYDWVEQRLQKDGLEIKSNRLKAVVTMYLDRLRIRKVGKKYYMPCRVKDPVLLAQIKEDMEFDEASREGSIKYSEPK